MSEATPDTSDPGTPLMLPTRPVVLVTGGSGGLGRGVVEVLVDAGARVHVPVRADDPEPLGRRARPGNPTLHTGVDLAREDAVERLFEAIRDAEDRSPEAVVNLAGGFSMAPIEKTDAEEWDRLWQINATTAFLVSRAAFPEMKSRRNGRIVNVSAMPAIERGRSGLSAYGAAKAAVLNLTRTLAKEGGDHGITVNAILPSIIDTPGNREAMPDAETSRWLDPVEIGKVVRFLISDDAKLINGAAIPLTSG